MVGHGYGYSLDEENGGDGWGGGEGREGGEQCQEFRLIH